MSPEYRVEIVGRQFIVVEVVVKAALLIFFLVTGIPAVAYC